MMRISTLSVHDVAALSLKSLGLDDELFVLDSPEAICASLRRAASFLCPTTPRALVDTVLEALSPVLEVPPTRDDLMSLVEQLISMGDLLELAEEGADRAMRLLFLGPPSFVEKSSGRYLVTGIRPIGAPLLPSDITLNYKGYTRTAVSNGIEAHTRLKEAGLHKISTQQWVGQPSTISARDYVDQYRLRLDVARAAGSVNGLTIIDPAARPNYYRGRWRPPATADSGDFVGRRPQAYGAPHWCVVRLANGVPKRLVDLPLDNTVWPARDDAWRLQAALDFERRTPLGYRVLPIPGVTPVAEYIVDIFSPLPSWGERYLELAGIVVDKSRGSLFSYRIPATALGELQSVLSATLWMSITEGESQ